MYALVFDIYCSREVQDEHQNHNTYPMTLILVGQTELWEQKLRLVSYAAIRQRIGMNIVLNRLDRAETGKYIAAHMAYAGVKQDLFTAERKMKSLRCHQEFPG